MNTDICVAIMDLFHDTATRNPLPTEGSALLALATEKAPGVRDLVLKYGQQGVMAALDEMSKATAPEGVRAINWPNLLAFITQMVTLFSTLFSGTTKTTTS